GSGGGRVGVLAPGDGTARSEGGGSVAGVLRRLEGVVRVARVPGLRLSERRDRTGGSGPRRHRVRPWTQAALRRVPASPGRTVGRQGGGEGRTRRDPAG